MSILTIRFRKKRENDERDSYASFAEKAGQAVIRPVFFNAALIGLCFLLSSTAWLTWEHRLIELTARRASDFLTMGAGYALQGVGVGLFALLLRKNEKLASLLALPALLLHTFCLIPVMMDVPLGGTVFFGLLINLFCGYLAGLYLYMLTHTVPREKRGLTLGLGYSFSILGSWLLSLINHGNIYSDKWLPVICLGMTAALLALLFLRNTLPAAAPAENAEKGEQKTDAGSGKPSLLLLTAGAVVLLFSLVNNCSFAFSSSDLIRGIRVETSRLFYAMGLIIAGILSDRDRKTGAVAALSALVIPFVLLALRGEPVPLTIFWALSYFAFGFYSLFRMILFTDLAEKEGLLFLSGFGLMIGKIGDAAGESLCLTLSPTALIFLTALFTIAAVFLFFRLYHPMYVPKKVRQLSEQEQFYQFSLSHDLSSRERDMLRLVLEEKTNAEIAEACSISENTVKFHIRNLLQKTGCRNRKDLMAVYMDQSIEN